jgi:predicted RNA-binding Zn-ribbon protein involved in translation (DUF1610 family)
VRYTNVRCVACQLSISPELSSAEAHFKCPACGRRQTLAEQPSRNKVLIPAATGQAERMAQGRNDRLRSLLEELLQYGPAVRIDGTIYVVTKVEELEP